MSIVLTNLTTEIWLSLKEALAIMDWENLALDPILT